MSVGTVVPLLVALALSACGAPSVRPLEPRVSVDAVRLLELGLLRQRIELTLKVQNPNPYALPISELDFTALLGDEPLASGSSVQAVNVPARGEARLPVVIELGLSRSLSRLGQQLGRHGLALDYRVTGSVKLSNWPRRLPFDVDGSLQDAIHTEERL